MRLTVSASGSWMNAWVTAHASSTCNSAEAQPNEQGALYSRALQGHGKGITQLKVSLIAGTPHLEDQQRGQAPHSDASIPAKCGMSPRWSAEAQFHPLMLMATTLLLAQGSFLCLTLPDTI